MFDIHVWPKLKNNCCLAYIEYTVLFMLFYPKLTVENHFMQLYWMLQLINNIIQYIFKSSYCNMICFVWIIFIGYVKNTANSDVTRTHASFPLEYCVLLWVYILIPIVLEVCIIQCNNIMLGFVLSLYFNIVII